MPRFSFESALTINDQMSGGILNVQRRMTRATDAMSRQTRAASTQMRQSLAGASRGFGALRAAAGLALAAVTTGRIARGITELAAARSAEFVDQLTNLKAVGRGVMQSALLPMMDAVIPIVQQIVAWTQANRELIRQGIDGFFERLRNVAQIIARHWQSGLIPAILAGVAAFQAFRALRAAGGLMSWLASGPVGLIIGAVVALGVGVYMLIKHWDTISTFFAGLWGNISTGVAAFVGGVRNRYRRASNYTLNATRVMRAHGTRRDGSLRRLRDINAMVVVRQMPGGRRGSARTGNKVPVPLNAARRGGNPNAGIAPSYAIGRKPIRQITR